jgi:hypothetical protein
MSGTDGPLIRFDSGVPAGGAESADGSPPAGDGTLEIEAALGRSLADSLDLGRWDRRSGLEALLAVAERAVGEEIREEGRLREAVRSRVLGRLAGLSAAPPGAGLYRTTEAERSAARRDVLLAGRAVAVAGAHRLHDGLATSIVTLGVAAVRYDGRAATWRTTFRRNDYRVSGGDLVEELTGFLDRRGRRDGAGPVRDRVPELLQRGFLADAERQALLAEGGDVWKIGRGLPAPLELLTGSGSAGLVDHALPVLRRLLLEGNRWVFLPESTASRALSTLADALEPGEVAVFQRLAVRLDQMLEGAHVPGGRRAAVEGFAKKLGEAAVVGGVRSGAFAPGRVFVAPAATALSAGLLAAADAELQPHAGRPLLMSLAELSARNGLGADVFAGVVQAAYARNRAAGRFASERVPEEP